MTLVIGILKDKDAVLAPLLATASRVIAVAAPSPRALPADELARTVSSIGDVSVAVVPDVGAALSQAKRDSGRAGIVCVTGSLALVGAARTELGLAPSSRL